METRGAPDILRASHIGHGRTCNWERNTLDIHGLTAPQPTTTVLAAMPTPTTRSIWMPESFSDADVLTRTRAKDQHSKENNSMKRNAFLLAVLAVGLCSAAWAGDIEGKVTGMKGHSVVYVDVIAGKTFPAPKEQPVIDQKGLLFAPHIVVVQQGTTVQFLNSDNVAHNVFWPSVGGDKKATHNLGTWPKGEKRPFTFDK